MLIITKKSLHYVIIVFISTFLGCNHQENSEGKESIVNFRIDSLIIPIDSTYLNSYYVFDYHNLEDKLIGYNRQKHAIDFLSLSKKEKSMQTILSKEGMNQVGDIQGINYLNKDSIFVLEYGFIKLMNQKGTVKEVFKLRNIANEKLPKSLVLSVNQYFKLRYNKKRNSILLFNTFGEEPYTDNYIVSEYHLKNRSLSPLNIKFVDSNFENNQQFGFFAYVNGALLGDSSLIYSYLYSPKIYKYDLNNGRTNCIVERNNLLKVTKRENAIGLQFSEKHAIENPHYFQIIEDPYKNLFYALCWKSIEYQVSKIQYNSFINKKLEVSVFNKNFVQIGSFELPTNTYMPFSWFVTPRGLMMSNTHPMNKNVSESNFTLHSIAVEL